MSLLRTPSFALFGAVLGQQQCPSDTVCHSEETVLMQGLKMRVIPPRNNKNSIDSLLESAGTMLKNGATPDVVDFARATLEEISGTVIPAIRNASASDQELVHAHFAFFEEALAELEERNLEIHEMNAQQRAHSAAHQACRQEEASVCDEKRECDYDLHGLWTTFIDEEVSMREINARINGHFCADANGTLATFRAASVNHMEAFFVQHPRVITAEEHYDDMRPVCETRITALNDKTEECDAHQLTLEQSSCAHAVLVRRVRNEFACSWQRAVELYNQTVTEVRILQEDRIVEFTTLAVVQCLIDRTTDNNGRPCDEATGEAEQEMTRCEQHRTTVDISFLELVYPEVPPLPPTCADRDSVTGRCYPELPHYPCQPQYINQEYSSLPEVPTPEFSEANSHCNARPECHACVEMDAELPECTIEERPPVATLPPVTVTHPPVTAPPPPATCGVPPAHENADGSTEDVPVGGTATYVCHEGFSVLGRGRFEQVVTCNANLRFTDLFACLPQTCGAPPNVRHAALAPGTPRQISHGMSATYQCHDGHVLADGSTSFEIPCDKGIFSHHAGCTPVSCGAPPTIETAIASTPTAIVAYPNSVEYDCRPGYTADGSIPSSFEVSCQADGSFSHGNCEPVVCGAPPTLSNAVWTEQSQALIDSGASIVSFAVLQYRCMEGFSFAGLAEGLSRNVECRANGQYNSLLSCLPINDCIGHTCGPFGVCVDQHMNYTCDCLDGYEIQHVQNNEGLHEIVCGNPDDCHGVQCGEGGTCEDQVGNFVCNCRPGFEQTNGLTSRCERVECGIPPTVENAIVTASRDGGGKTVFEDVIGYQCLPGFSTDGQQAGPRDFTITCQDSGSFSAVSSCIPIDCGQPSQVEHATVSGEAVSFPNAVEYQCDEGYTTTGAAGGATTFQKFCTESGRLLSLSLGQSVSVSCRPVTCGTPPSFDRATVGNPAVHTFGEVAEYTCIEGFATDPADASANTFTSQCMQDGSWTDGADCSPVTCALPDDADVLATFNGLPTIAGHAVTIADSLLPVVYQCKDGYTVDGNPGSAREQVGVCNEQGVFTVRACVPVVCAYGNMVHGPQASIVGEERDFHFGESATLQCNAGWEIAPTNSAGLTSRIRSTTEFVVDCLATGQFSAPLHCQNIDDCEGHTCGAHGTCVDGMQDYSCTCQAGYEESIVSGQKVCGDINDCNGASCGAAGTCTDRVGSFVCECGLGHENEDGNDPTSPCVPKTCQLPVLDNTQMEAALTLNFQQIEQIECEIGFSTAVGDHFAVECSADGSIAAQGGGEIPTCVPKSCGPAPLLVLAAVAPDASRHFVFGESANYVCQGGELQIEYQCGAGGWIAPSGEGAFETCQNSCGAATRPINGRRSGAGAVFHPDSAEVSCDEGYTHLASGAYSEASNHLTQQCLATGQFVAWGAEVSTTEDGRLECVPIQCERPSPPSHWQWSGNGVFDTRTPATLECAEGYSLTGMPHASTVHSVVCNGDGSHSQLPEACVPITHRMQCLVEDAVTGDLLANADIVVTDASGATHTATTDEFGIWSIDNLLQGTVSVTVTLQEFTTMEFSLDLQHDLEHGSCDSALNPHLGPNSWRAVLTWSVNPRDLDGHVTRHPVGPDGPTLEECPCSERTHLYWRQTWMRSVVAHPVAFWTQVEDETRPAASLDRDNVYGGGIPETITYFRMNTCTHDCLFVYRVWDYCSLPNAMVDESEALVRLYNSDGLHSTYTIAGQGRMHSADGYVNEVGEHLVERRWDVFQLDASGEAVRVEDCSSGNCPDDVTHAPYNHAWC